MTSTTVPERRTRVGPRIPQKYVPILMTLALLASMFTIGSIRYPGFATGQVVLNVFIDNSFLLVVAIGMTFVILTGGIDLSVGAVVALSTLMLALLVKHGWPTLLAIVVVLVIGSTLGWTMGAVIHYFEIQPFIVTLAGMFLARGLCYAITVDAVSITKPGYVAVAEHTFNLRATCTSPRLWSSRSSRSSSESMCCTTRGSAATSMRSAGTSNPPS